jgi:hypothetical protein
MAIVGDNEQLVVDIVARVTDLEKGMARASRIAGKRFGDIEKRAEQSSNRISAAFKNFGTGLVAGLAAGGIAGIVSQIGNVAKAVASISDEAKRAGVTTQVFQEWSAVAQSARIPIDALVDGFKELNIRADEFATTGKGSAAEAFARLGLTPAEVKERIKDPAEFMLLLIDRTRLLNDTAASTRIFDEVFGGTGAERMVTLLDQSTESIRGTIEEAHRLGNVISDDVIARAADLDRQFNIVATTVGSALKTAIVEASAALVRFIDEFREFENRNTGSLQTRLGELNTRRGQLLGPEGQPGLVQSGLSLFGKGAKSELAAIDAEMAAIAAELKQRALPKLRQELLQQSAGTTPYVPPPATTGGSGRSATTSAAEREAEAIRRLTAELQEELRLVGASDVEKRASSVLRGLAASATDEEREKIVLLNEALFQGEEAQRRTADQAAFFRDGMFDAFASIIPAIETGNAALDRFISTMIQAVAQAALLGTGPLGGMLGGGLLSFAHGGEVRVPGYAGGGSVSGPGTGTSDSILAKVSDGEYVVRASQAKRHRALLEQINAGAPVTRLHRPANNGAGDVFNMPVSVTVSASGGTPEANADLARKTARETSEAVRSVVTEELIRHKRVGGLLHGS